MKKILLNEIVDLKTEKEQLKIRLLEIEQLIQSKSNLIAKLDNKLPAGQIRIQAEINRHNKTGNVTIKTIKKLKKPANVEKLDKVELDLDGLELIF
jgi:hypothetical protein